ncbi:MAG: bifunctional demethylmenaquinone methyltransferase/2-methoxy-6-polyprenyl-1,4-benzoquinol methylase UbiE [Candidatus Zixiibacteriota bacterium]
MSQNRTENRAPSRRDVWRMFDRISHRYDLLNHLLSMNRDVAWRKRMSRHLPDRPDLKVLDLATGTADQLLSLYDSGKVGSGVGIDLAEKMLEVGRRKIKQRGLESALELQIGDAENIPFDDNRFDAVSISFGIRNVIDVPHALSEMHRILNSEGRALILEFSLPKSRWIRSLYLIYFRKILPRLGGLISGDREAYQYLNDTVETFPYGEEFCRLMRDAGFDNVQAIPLTFGIATLYRGDT